MKHSFTLVAMALLALGSTLLSGCRKDDPLKVVSAENLVVYGKIYTAEDNGNAFAEAFVVENGKFVYVGSRDGAQQYIHNNTRIIDHTGKGLVMPGCYESHAHYLMANAIPLMGGPSLTLDTDPDQFLHEVRSAYRKAKAAGKHNIYGFGWMYQAFDVVGMPTRQQLDSVCPDIALFVNDAEVHKALANTQCLKNAGILDANGNVLISHIRGGEICMDENGKPTGLLKEQAASYVRSHGINFNEILPTSTAVQALTTTSQMLHKNGFISYMDGWSNIFGPNVFYEAAEQLDRDGRLNMLLGMAYEFESSTADVQAEIDKAIKKKKYTKGHINADYVKLFIDGTVESGTGFTLEPYQATEFGHGMANWEEAEVADITRLANAANMTMHVHTMGDAAVHRAVNAFESAGRSQLRNTIVHARNVPPADFQRIADNNIVTVCGILWHAMDPVSEIYLNSIIPENLIGKAYPIKSYFDHGAIMTSHSDYPATSDSPYDPFGIMEIAVTGSLYDAGQPTPPFWTEEIISRQQALQALTLNGAYQMHVENERGSIKVGKYADFILADKDVLQCPVSDIHNTKVLSTWFEGKKVYPLN